MKRLGWEWEGGNYEEKDEREEEREEERKRVVTHGRVRAIEIGTLGQPPFFQTLGQTAYMLPHHYCRFVYCTHQK